MKSFIKGKKTTANASTVGEEGERVGEHVLVDTDMKLVRSGVCVTCRQRGVHAGGVRCNGFKEHHVARTAFVCRGRKDKKKCLDCYCTQATNADTQRTKGRHCTTATHYPRREESNKKSRCLQKKNHINLVLLPPTPAPISDKVRRLFDTIPRLRLCPAVNSTLSPLQLHCI